jgi:8-oxo-dGTP pyrophosphatase MutT (NUDIX family)
MAEPAVESEMGPGDDSPAELERWLGGAAGRVHPEATPRWMVPLVDSARTVRAVELSRNDPPAVTVGARQAAVLILLGEGDGSGPEVLVQQRAVGLRAHPGEVSFPGGAFERGDVSPVETALREAWEETGLDRAGVDPVAVLPRLEIPVSGFQVTAILAHWRRSSPVRAVDAGETAQVHRLSLTALAEPDRRLMVSNGRGWLGPAFQLPGMVIWGITAELLDAVLRMGGWERPWVRGQPRQLSHAWRAALEENGWAEGSSPDEPPSGEATAKTN